MAAHPVKDHLNQEFPSITEMCKHWNIPTSTFNNRMKSPNYTLELALTLPPDNHRNAGMKCVDHLGTPFKSKQAMCKHWGIPRAVYFGRVKLGWELKDILTKPLDYNGGAPKVYDHEGTEFDSIGDMCDHWGINRTTFNERIRRKWPLKKALTTKSKNIKVVTTPCVDPYGKKFPSKAAMYAYYGTNKTIVNSRLKLGWKLEDILKNPDIIDPHKPCQDHLGQEFPSIGAMLEHWGINEMTYRSRKARGMPLKDILTTSNLAKTECIDCFGKEFPSIKDMCNAHNIKPATLWLRKKNNWPLFECLYGRNWHNLKNVTFINNFTLLNAIKVPKQRTAPEYFLCKVNDHDVILSRLRVIELITETDQNLEIIVKEL